MHRSKKIQDDLGNTMTRSSYKKIQDSPAKGWFFTLAVEHEGVQLTHGDVIKKLDPISNIYVFQLESGEKTGYSHYQGMMSLRSKKRFDPLKRELWPWIHLEKTIYEPGAQEYCMKEDTRLNGPWSKGVKPILNNLIENYYDWQINCRERWINPAKPRVIEWIWGPKGNDGKSTFAHDCFRKLPKCAVTTCEKPTDVELMAQEDIRIYIIDIPRASRCRPYIALEKLKNGFVTEAKLKGQQRIVDMWEIPHVIVFCNEEPDRSKMSEDRWIITRI